MSIEWTAGSNKQSKQHLHNRSAVRVPTGEAVRAQSQPLLIVSPDFGVVAFATQNFM